MEPAKVKMLAIISLILSFTSCYCDLIGPKGSNSIKSPPTSIFNNYLSNIEKLYDVKRVVPASPDPIESPLGPLYKKIFFKFGKVVWF